MRKGATPSKPGSVCRRWGFTEEKRQHARDEKHNIARYVADLIPKGCAVFLDAGSTVEFVAREIFNREARMPQSLTIMTNNMGVFNCFNAGPRHGGPPLAHTLALLLTGGHYDKDHDALFGYQAAVALESFYPRVVVIGTSGFTVLEGLFYHGHTPEQVIKEAIFQKPTEHRIIVCDHRKIGKTDSFLAGRFGDLLKNAERCTIVTSDPPGGSPLSIRLDREAKQFNERLNQERDKDRTGWAGQLCLVVIGDNGKVAMAHGDPPPEPAV